MPGSGGVVEIQPGQQVILKPDRWLDYWHGRPDPPVTWRFLRCKDCQRLVTWHQIHSGLLCPCGGKEMRPAYLSIWELVKVNFLPWMVRG